MEFDFEGTNVQWFVLSEIIMCDLPAAGMYGTSQNKDPVPYS